MSALLKDVTAPTPAPTKMVSLHHFAHEEQVKSTDQGNTTVSKGRVRKNLLPASNLAKVPTRQMTVEEELMLIQKQFDALPAAEKALITARVKASLEQMQEHLPLLAKAMSGKVGAPTPAPTGDDQAPTAPKVKAPTGELPAYNPWEQSILMLYTNFAETQMNQNGLVMNGWESQQQAQNQTLQEAATAEAKNAATPTEVKKPSWWKILLIGLGVLLGAVLVCTGIGAAAGAGVFAFMGVAAGTAGLSFGATAVVAGIAAGATVGACYGAADSDPNSTANAGLVEKGTDQTIIDKISFSNQFWNTVSQKTNNQIASGSQTNLVDASSNDTQLGQQAAQVIQAMGQVMQTPVAH